MKLNTLNSIIDDIILTLRNSTVSESEHISRILIEQWVHNYRAFLIKLRLDKGYDLDDLFTLTLSNVHFDKVENTPGHFVYQSDIELPKLISSNNTTGVISVKDLFGNLIERGHATRSKYLKFRKYACKDYFWWVSDTRVYIDGDSNLLEYADVKVIAENPADLATCFDPDSAYPVPGWMIPTIKDLIFDHELRIMPVMPTDTINNTEDDVQNISSLRRNI